VELNWLIRMMKELSYLAVERSQLANIINAMSVKHTKSSATAKIRRVGGHYAVQDHVINLF